MPEQPSVATSSASQRQSKALIAALIILFRATLAVLLISFFAAIFPIDLQEPLWYLKAGQLALDYSVTLLFALLLILLAADYRYRYNKSSRLLRLAAQVCSIAIIFYAIMIPLQVISYGWYWQASGQRAIRLIQQEQSKAETFKQSLAAAKSDDEFRGMLIKEGIPLPPPDLRLELSEQKYRASEAVDGQFFQRRVRLESERNQQLINLGVNASKGVVGAGVVVYAMVALKKLLTA